MSPASSPWDWFFAIVPLFESSDDSNGNVAAVARHEFLVRWSKRLVCAGLGALVVLGALRGYGAWRQQHLGKQVQQFVARGEFQSAVLVARRLLVLDENNLAACTAMAEMAEKAGQPEAVVWRKRLAHLQPGSIPHQLALARAALRFGQHDLAERVLDAMPETARQDVQYHQLAGALALSDKQLATAASHFETAAQLAPNDLHLALNLALIRLAAPEQQIAGGARVKLAELAAQPAVRLETLRALTADSLARKKSAEAQKWAAQLRTEKETTFADVLLCLNAYEATDKAAAILEELKIKAAATAATAAELITWLNRNGMAVVAAHWSKSLPPENREIQPVPLAVAESYSFMQDWKTMLALVEDKNWGEYEALRLAVESHALHRLGATEHRSMQTATIWHSALEKAKQHPEQVVVLAQLAEGWGYKEDAVEAWWIVASANHNPRAGLGALQRLYKDKQDSRGLLRVAKRALELNPGDLVAANNCANLSLLLSADSTARRLAAKLHSEHPGNRAFAATYAFALQTEGRLPEALQLMETLKDEELRHPSIAAYYFVMLVESGNMDRARSYLAAAKSATLLPEELQLVTAATRKLLASETGDTAKRVAGSSTR